MTKPFLTDHDFEDPPAAPAIGPTLFEPRPDAPLDRMDVAWAPVVLAPPPRPRSAMRWIGRGLALFGLAWILGDAARFVADQVARGDAIGIGTLAACAAGAGLVGFGVAMEVRALSRLHRVDRLRGLLADPAAAPETVRAEAAAWVARLPRAGIDLDAAQAALAAAPDVVAVREVLRAAVISRLRERARATGLRAAGQGAALVAVTPSVALDGLLGAGRALLLVREIATIYGLRPGPAVLAALFRRIARTAAEIAATEVMVQALTDHAIGELPGLRHLARASGVSVAAIRLYRLAAVTAEACAPLRLR
jgi:putative membrane protein